MNWYFTKKGDDGKTSLRGGNRLYKNESIFKLIGALDELTAQIGMSISFCSDEELKRDLKKIQTMLSELMGIIAEDYTGQSNASQKLERMVEWIEKKIMSYGERLEKPQTFVFSGGNTLGAALDICRTIARRAEREAVGLFRNSRQFDRQILAILNRLSSLMFLMRLYAEKD